MERYYDNTTASAVKCSSWLRCRRRPAFMEPLRMSSSFPLKDDAGYIGYLTDDDDERGGSGGGSGGDDIISVVHRRRRELLGPDISFTMCCLLMMMVMMVMAMMVMVWWGFRWGFRPPATVTTFDRPGGGFAPP
jgi:hypothetical protein